MSQGGTKNRFFRKTPRESTGKCLISSQLNFYQNRTKTHEIRANDLVGGESIHTHPTSAHLGVPTLKGELSPFTTYSRVLLDFGRFLSGRYQDKKHIKKYLMIKNSPEMKYLERDLIPV